LACSARAAALPLWGWAGRRTRRHRRGRPHAGDLRLPWGDLLQPRELRNRLPLPRATRPEARTNYFLAQPRLRAGTRERRLLPHPGRNRTVSELKPRTGADDGEIQVAFFDEEGQELEWLTDQLQQRWESFKKRKEAAAVSGEKVDPFSAAVLVRKNKEALPIFELLRAKGVPVELSG